MSPYAIGIQLCNAGLQVPDPSFDVFIARSLSWTVFILVEMTSACDSGYKQKPVPGNPYANKPTGNEQRIGFYLPNLSHIFHVWSIMELFSLQRAADDGHSEMVFLDQVAIDWDYPGLLRAH